MTLWVKICGLMTEEAVDAAVSAGADAIGLVHFPPSPRHLDLPRLRELADHARGRAEIVVLTVDADNGTVLALHEYARPDCLQLHGREDGQRMAFLSDLTGLPLMKAVGIGGAADLDAIDPAAAHADRVLLDAKPPRGATRPGGNGLAFDWRLLEALDAAKPIVLSGGLTPANVRDAVALVRPFGVDVSSGVERAPGDKDPDLIAAFVRAARSVADAHAAPGTMAADIGHDTVAPPAGPAPVSGDAL